MDIETIVDQLQRTHAGSRKLDSNIALALNWRLQTDIILSPETGDQIKRHMWFRPNSNEITTVPFWTTNLGDAYRLVLEIAPKQRGGCSWEFGQASAKIGDGPYVQAVTGPIALCIAALTIKRQQA